MRRAGVFFIGWLFILGVQASGPIGGVEVQPLKATSVAVGEAFTQHIRVRTGAGVQLEADFLPHAGDALEGGLEVRRVDWARQEAGADWVYDFKMSYQLFRAVSGQERVAIPEQSLHFMADGKPIEVVVPVWEVKLSSQIPAEQADTEVRIREPMDVVLYPLADELKAFGLALLASALVGLSACWILALPPFRWRRRPPFEQAWHELNKLARRQPSQAVDQQAYRIVHQALNRSAGYTVFRDRLGRYLGENPSFDPLRPKLEAFFAESWREFFGAGGSADQADGIRGLMELAQAAMVLERSRS